MHNDLREWIEKAEKMGKLVRISGAHWEKEMAALAELFLQKKRLETPMKYLENSRIISWTLAIGSNARQYVAEEDSLKHMELHCQIENCKNKAPDNGSYQNSLNPSYFSQDLEKGESEQSNTYIETY